MVGMQFLRLLVGIISIVLPMVLLYMIIKLAVKRAIRELKNDGFILVN